MYYVYYLYYVWQGKSSVDNELNDVKGLVDHLSKRITDMNEKMYDFEQNKVETYLDIYVDGWSKKWRDAVQLGQHF